MKRFFTGPPTIYYDTETSEFRLATQEEMNVLTAALNDPDSVRQWIPVSERLPEKEGEYLVTLDGRIRATTVASWEYTQYHKCPQWRWNHHFGVTWVKDRVIAWMPLPAPYKEDV